MVPQTPKRSQSPAKDAREASVSLDLQIPRPSETPTKTSSSRRSSNSELESDIREDTSPDEPRIPTYLEERAMNIARNRAQLAELGLLGSSKDLLGDGKSGKGSKKKGKKKKGPIRYVSPSCRGLRNVIRCLTSHSPEEVPQESPSPTSPPPACSEQGANLGGYVLSFSLNAEVRHSFLL